MTGATHRAKGAIASIPKWVLGFVGASVIVVGFLVYLSSSRMGEDEFAQVASGIEAEFPEMLQVDEAAEFRAYEDLHEYECPTGLSGHGDPEETSLRAEVVAELEDEGMAEELLGEIESSWTTDYGWSMIEQRDLRDSGRSEVLSTTEYSREWDEGYVTQAFVEHNYFEDVDAHAVHIRVSGDCVRHTDSSRSTGDYSLGLPPFIDYSWAGNSG